MDFVQPRDLILHTDANMPKMMLNRVSLSSISRTLITYYHITQERLVIEQKKMKSSFSLIDDGIKRVCKDSAKQEIIFPKY